MVALPLPAKRGGLDRWAISASTLCLLHCLALPVLIGFLPSLGAWIDPGEGFHLAMLAIAVPLSATALVRGWRRHGQALPLLGGVIGLALLTLGVAFEGAPLGTLSTVAGGVALAVSHVLNLRGERLAALGAI